MGAPPSHPGKDATQDTVGQIVPKLVICGNQGRPKRLVPGKIFSIFGILYHIDFEDTFFIVYSVPWASLRDCDLKVWNISG